MAAMTQAAPVQGRVAARTRILAEAARLLDTGGLDAMSTRAVASAAQVSTPVIYREFNDKDGLLSAVIGSVLEGYWADKQRVSYATDDPLEDLRQLFNLHVQFGLTHPYCYAIAYVVVPDHAGIARLLSESPFLLQVMQRIAAQGRLRVSAEDAAHLMAVAGVGSVLT
jgi:AcrR family transcriptional regulator